MDAKNDRRELIGSSRHARSDSRMAARLLSLGVVSNEVAESCLRKAFVLALRTEKARDYAAAMAVPVAVTRLELDAAKASYLMGLDDSELPEGLREIRDEDFFGNRERLGDSQLELPTDDDASSSGDDFDSTPEGIVATRAAVESDTDS